MRMCAHALGPLFRTPYTRSYFSVQPCHHAKNTRPQWIYFFSFSFSAHSRVARVTTQVFFLFFSQCAAVSLLNGYASSMELY
jgi:hypothetical protein